MEPFSPEARERERLIVRELTQQSDRGAAIIGVAWVEEALVDALTSFLQNDVEARESLFRPSGPLSSFAAKIDLARLLGLTSKAVTSDLHTLRRIRNEFAHLVFAKGDTPLGFASTSITARCLNLEVVAHIELDDPRVAFVRTCAILNADFYMHRLIGNKIDSQGQVFAEVEDESRKRARRAS